MANHAGGISIVTFVVALAVSMGYYQFVYLPEANARPIVPEEIREPRQTTEVAIVEDAQNNPNSYKPREARAVLGLSNKVVWTNDDSIPHTVTTDDDYEDPYSGVFDVQVRPQDEGGAFVMPGETYEFLFTQEGEYPYHCVPHPQMKGIVEVIPNFA
ncbi:MAG: cupredoxin domain-containing protein [Nitrososphaera sp.]